VGPKSTLRQKLKLRPATMARTLTVLGSVIAPLLLAGGVDAGTTRPALQSHRHPGYKRGMASWYRDDGLQTACGFHAKYGVANRTLPCHTHVTFWHDHHKVKAVVDDRGPYVAGREWDLDEKTAKALNVPGVSEVWAKWPSS
jgi:rare lipoprotein A (peptidoglycan hydrolase)